MKKEMNSQMGPGVGYKKNVSTRNDKVSAPKTGPQSSNTKSAFNSATSTNKA